MAIHRKTQCSCKIAEKLIFSVLCSDQSERQVADMRPLSPPVAGFVLRGRGLNCPHGQVRRRKKPLPQWQGRAESDNPVPPRGVLCFPFFAKQESTGEGDFEQVA